MCSQKESLDPLYSYQQAMSDKMADTLIEQPTKMTAITPVGHTKQSIPSKVLALLLHTINVNDSPKLASLLCVINRSAHQRTVSRTLIPTAILPAPRLAVRLSARLSALLDNGLLCMPLICQSVKKHHVYRAPPRAKCMGVHFILKFRARDCRGKSRGSLRCSNAGASGD